MSLLKAIFGDEEAGKASLVSTDLFENKIGLPGPEEPTTQAQDAVAHSSSAVEFAARTPSFRLSDNQLDNPDERTVFVGNLPISITRKALAAVFSDCGKVESTRIRSVATMGVKLPPSCAGNQRLVKKICTHSQRIDAAAKSNVHGYVVFAEPASVPVAIQRKNNIVLDQHRIRVDTASPTVDPYRSVFVGNLPYLSQEETLRQHFLDNMPGISSEEDILGVRIIRDSESFKCRGFGYILFSEKLLVSDALQQVHGTRYMGKELRVLVCSNRSKGRSQSGSKRKGSNDLPEPMTTKKVGALKRILSKQATKVSSNLKRKRGDRKPSFSEVHSVGKSKKQTSVSKRDKREKAIRKKVNKSIKKQKRSHDSRV